MTILPRRVAAALALSTAAVAGLGACASSTGAGATSSKPPAQAFKAAVAKLTDANALTITAKIDATADQLVAIDKAGSGQSTLTTDQAKTLAGGTAVLAIATNGSSFRDARKDAKRAQAKESFAFTLNGGGAPGLVEVRYVDQALFARADVAKVASLAKADTAQLDKIGSSPVAGKYPFIKDALAGKWLKLPVAELLDAAKGFTGSGGIPSVDPSRADALQGAFGKIFDQDVQVSRQDADSDLGDHLVLTGSSRTLATDFVTAIKTSLSSLPQVGPALGAFDPARVPDQKIAIDAFAKNGALDAVKVDVSQFAHGSKKAAFGGKPLYLELDLDRSASIAKPSQSTEVTFGSLIGAFGAFGLAAGQSSSSGAEVVPTAPTPAPAPAA